MRIVWYGPEVVATDLRAAVNAEILASLGPIPASSIYVVADQTPMQIRIIARSADMKRRLGRAANLHGLATSEVRACVAEIVAALVRDWPEIADMMRESEPA